MKRISPVLVLLFAAGCANAGISDWLNPFRMFGGKQQQAGSASGVQQSPKGAGHRGVRQLYPSSAPSASGPLGSPAGYLDDGFKPSFPPGFASPPSHSPNLNPFAVGGSDGPAAGSAKGPLFPSQLTNQHHPSSAPQQGAPFRPRGRFGFRNRSPPHHAAASTVGGSEGPSQGNAPLDFEEYKNVPGAFTGNDFDESQNEGPPQHAGGAQRGPPGPPPGYHHRPHHSRPHGRPGPPQSFNPQSGRPGGPAHFGRPLHAGPGGPPGGPGGPSYIDGGHESQGIFGGQGPLGPGPSAGPPGGRGSDTPFFAPSPGGFRGGPGGPGQDSQSPFSGAPQSAGQFGPGGPSGNPFGDEGASQGPSEGPGSNGPQGFFNADGNDYPEQFQGGNRETRQPQGPLGLGISPQEFQPQPNGPPEGSNGSPDEQNEGFFGALHHNGNSPPGGSYYGGNPQNQQEAPGIPSLDQSGGNSPFLNPGNNFGQAGPGPRGEGPSYAPSYAPSQRPRKPPVRLGLRNALASAYQTSSSNVPAYGVPLMMSATGGKPIAIRPVPKAPRLLRPFIRKPGILSLSSPKDPQYRPMMLSASSLNPVSASFEPDTAASGGLHHGIGDVGLSHNGDRILYHVGGHQGPHSYRFGFDTGKGHNRIFRFEEKDGKGHVKGKYGFYDKHGKLNLINYQAHPQHGYHAERGHSHGHY